MMTTSKSSASGLQLRLELQRGVAGASVVASNGLSASGLQLRLELQRGGAGASVVASNGLS
jgi:hypothetical protein